jgi:hypothetical protein
MDNHKGKRSIGQLEAASGPSAILGPNIPHPIKNGLPATPYHAGRPF